ncbi:sensor histidine kinase [Motiliproteus sediminis]|uniref:sensor histidine kinase n=1 Tax=Motiliproteus sediminis TaxID=1468178 RepID=UPI001AEFDA78|nr:HAMP domain-containing sensor histidine kinase [Motiliproteus sediminis]
MPESDNNNKKPVDLSLLRRKAENRIEEWHLEFSPPHEQTDLLHELQVHQIELMMQNDELQRAQQELMASRNHYVQLFNQTPIGYALINQRGEVNEVNDTLRRLLQWTGGHPAVQFFVELLHPDERDVFRARFRALFKQPEGKHLDIALQSADGSPIPVRMNACRFSSSSGYPKLDHEQQLLLSIVDMSKQRQLENEIARRAETAMFENKKMATIGQLVDQFTHDVCSVMSGGILSLGTLQQELISLQDLLAREDRQSPAIDQKLALIREDIAATLNAQRKVSDMAYSFKRTSIDQTSERPRRFTLQQLLEDVCRTFKTQLAQQQVQLSITCDQELPLEGSPGYLDQLLFNLIGNSLTHGFNGSGGTIRLTAALDNQRLQLIYEDDGCGFSAEQQQRAFERYYSGNPDQSHSGLGLYIVKTITEQKLGGSVRLDSSPGLMTRFTLTVPLQRSGKLFIMGDPYS